MRGFRTLFVRAVAATALLGFAPSAFAYLDPSTGSMILSAIVGVFATLMLAIKTYWYKLKSFFSGRSGGAHAQESVPENTSEEGKDEA